MLWFQKCIMILDGTPKIGALGPKTLVCSRLQHLRHDFERCIDDVESQTDETGRRISVLLHELNSHSWLNVTAWLGSRVRQVVVKFFSYSRRWTDKTKLQVTHTLATRRWNNICAVISKQQGHMHISPLYWGCTSKERWQYDYCTSTATDMHRGPVYVKPSSCRGDKFMISMISQIC